MDYVTHCAPLPQRLPKFLSLIYPFDPFVWMAVFSSFVLYGFAFYLLCKLFLKTAIFLKWVYNKPCFSNFSKIELDLFIFQQPAYKNIFIEQNSMNGPLCIIQHGTHIAYSWENVYLIKNI